MIVYCIIIQKLYCYIIIKIKNVLLLLLLRRTFIVDTMQIPVEQHQLNGTDFFLDNAPFVYFCMLYLQSEIICEQILNLFLLYYLSSRITLHAQRKINSDSITNQAASYTCTSVIKAYINLKSIYLDTCTFHVNRVTNKLLSTILSLFISKQIYCHCFYKSISELYELHQHHTRIHFRS